MSPTAAHKWYAQYFSVPHRFLQDSQDSWGFPRIPQDSSGLLYNFGDFELGREKYWQVPRNPQDLDRIPAKLEYITSLARGHVI